jgi:chromosome segregation ATPase
MAPRRTPGQLHDISRAIGGIEQSQQAAAEDRREFKESLRAIRAQMTELALDVKEDRAISTQDRAHAAAERVETRQKLDNVDARLDMLEKQMSPLAQAVAAMQPIVTGYQISRWKLAGALALGTVLATGALSLIGWLASLFAGKLFWWLISLVR